MIGTTRKAGRDTAAQVFAAEGSGHFTESRRLRQLPPAAPALALRALCLLDGAFSAGCTIQAALQQVLEDTARRQDGGLAERDRPLAAELAYITCTLHPLENEQAVDWLLAEDSGLERLVQWQTPHDHPWLEGMFAARLRRRG